MQLRSAEEAAAQLGVSPKSVKGKRWRIRGGLPATKIGRRTMFRESDLEKLISRGRERLPTGAEGSDVSRR
jgi:excisionase family DNA binding protein